MYKNVIYVLKRLLNETITAHFLYSMQKKYNKNLVFKYICIKKY
jgi:neutral trehalase